MVSEIPNRLTGVRYVAAVALCTTALGVQVERWIGRRLREGTVWAWRAKSLVYGLALALVLIPTIRRYHDLVVGKGYFFTADYRKVKPVSLTPGTLKDLDPCNEPMFFVSLAEYLYARQPAAREGPSGAIPGRPLPPVSTGP